MLLLALVENAALQQPLVFAPLFQERVWGGRRLEKLFGKSLPPRVPIGESWEIVDRPEAQSVVRLGPLHGKTLHELWSQNRAEFFGDVPDAPRFPIFVKLLDAEETLSLQVHPPAHVAAEFGSEPKTEFWYIADAKPDAELFVGLTSRCSPQEFKRAIEQGNVVDLVHRVPVQTGDAMFLPSGRLHAIGGGNVIVEIQQNSDTTYRVFDWNRAADGGAPRQLHIAESLRSIDFDDVQPAKQKCEDEALVRHELFAVEKWEPRGPRELAPPGQFAIVGCLTGAVECAGLTIQPGEFFLLPATLASRKITAAADHTTLLRITLPI